MSGDDRELELGVGDVVIVTVAGADAPAVRLEALEDGSLRLLPAVDGGPGPFVHADARDAGSPPPAESPAPHR